MNRKYLEAGKLRVEQIGRGIAWLDTGTPRSLLQASNFFGVIEERQGMKVACIEEIAFFKKFINEYDLQKIISEMPVSDYRNYLEKLLD